MKEIKNFAKGAVFGGIVGSIIGIFTAPKKGEKMQEGAKDFFQDIVKNSSKTY